MMDKKRNKADRALFTVELLGRIEALEAKVAELEAQREAPLSSIRVFVGDEEIGEKLVVGKSR